MEQLSQNNTITLIVLSTLAISSSIILITVSPVDGSTFTPPPENPTPTLDQGTLGGSGGTRYEEGVSSQFGIPDGPRAPKEQGPSLGGSGGSRKDLLSKFGMPKSYKTAFTPPPENPTPDLNQGSLGGSGGSRKDGENNFGIPDGPRAPKPVQNGGTSGGSTRYTV